MCLNCVDSAETNIHTRNVSFAQDLFTLVSESFSKIKILSTTVKVKNTKKEGQNTKTEDNNY